jgi:hypothetical protein
MFIRIVVFATIIEAVTKLKNVQTEAGMGTTESKWWFAEGNLALFVGLVGVVSAVIVPITGKFARNTNTVGAFEFKGRTLKGTITIEL